MNKKVVTIRRTWRRPDDEKKIASDNECLRILKEAVTRCEATGEEFVMADECLFNQKHILPTAWSNKHENLVATTMVKSENCLAVVGAVSAQRGSILNYAKAKSIKAVDFLEFL